MRRSRKQGELFGKRIVLGITGSISAYKACGIVSSLKKLGAEVSVVLTETAMRFVSPVLLQTLSHNKVHCDLFSVPERFDAEHVSLAEAADLILLAPATANTIAKIASGIADNLLTATVLASKAPILIAPAMNENMYLNSITQDNIKKLKKRGFKFIGPEYGLLASGEKGWGRLIEERKIIEQVCRILSLKKKAFQGKTFLITAGPTREYLDPVRFISNASSGKMGYALAEVAREAGAEVILVSGPTGVTPPEGVRVVHVNSAREMEKEVLKFFPRSNVVIAAAAVSDYRPETEARSKIKADIDRRRIDLVRNPDILAELGRKKRKKVLVGFALETDDLERNALKKLKQKNLDMVIATTPEAIEKDEATVKLITRDGKKLALTRWGKRKIAEKILAELERFLKHG